VDIAAKETQLWSYNWINSLNAEAIRRFKEKWNSSRWTRKPHRVPQDHQDLSGRGQGQVPGRKKGLDSQEAFIADFADWRDARSGATPWPYETYVGGRITE
jgi:hypothetical protein